ncbi:MAG: hypothetical protein ACE5KF_09735 [Kiloniellaceae bacterium]
MRPSPANPRRRRPFRSGRFGAIALLLVAAWPAAAEPVTLGGLTFSDERGGFTIVSAAGGGSLADPFIVVEEVTGEAPVVLVIRGLSPRFGNRVGSHHLVGFALNKVMINRTAKVWTGVDLELQQALGTPSDTYDGLSFGQAAVAGRPFRSDRFAGSTEVTDPLDAVAFREGIVRPGQRVTFNVIVTHTRPASLFHLIQRIDQVFEISARAMP